MKSYQLLIATLSLFGGLAQAAQVDYVVAKKQENERLQAIKLAADKNDEAFFSQKESHLSAVLPVVLHQLIKDYCFNYREDFFAAVYQSIPLVGCPKHSYAVAMTPDCGTTMTCAGVGSKLRVWNETGVCIASLDKYSVAAVTPDGHFVVYGSFDGEVRVWDKISNEVNELIGHTGIIASVAIATNGNIIAGVGDGMVKVWDRLTGRCLFTPPIHGVDAIIVSADGGTIVTRAIAHEVATVQVWDVSGNRLCTLVYDCVDTLAKAITANDDTIVTAGYYTVKVWKIATGECIKVLQHDDCVSGVVVSPKGNKLMIVSRTIIAIWDIASGACIEKFSVPNLFVQSFANEDAFVVSSNSHDQDMVTVRKFNQQIRRQLSKLSFAQLTSLKQLLSDLSEVQNAAVSAGTVKIPIILSKQQGAALFALPLEYQRNICAHYNITEAAEAFNKRMEQDCKKTAE